MRLAASGHAVNGINLLPWRQQKRRDNDQRMIAAAALIWILCAVLIFGVYSRLQLSQHDLRMRNNYLTTEISNLQQRIEEIQNLRQRKQHLFATMQAIRNLQRQRNQLVQIFNDIVGKLPDGVYFEKINKKDQEFSFTGTAQSNARVSRLMENLGSSDWFNKPDLNVINIARSHDRSFSQFDLKVTRRSQDQPPGSG